MKLKIMSQALWPFLSPAVPPHAAISSSDKTVVFHSILIWVADILLASQICDVQTNKISF